MQWLGTNKWSSQTCRANIAAQFAICLLLASQNGTQLEQKQTDRHTDRQVSQQAPHLEAVGLEIHSIKSNAVAGLLHRAQVQEGILGLGPNSSRGPVIQRAGGDSRALFLGVCCHGSGVCHDGVKEGGQLGLAGLKGEVAHVEALGGLGGFLCCSLQQCICSLIHCLDHALC